MAKDKHIEILKQGVDVWNSLIDRIFPLTGRRLVAKDELEVNLMIESERPDLSHSDLKGLNLDGIKFYRTNLEGADLRDSILANATLIRANLNSANLRRAKIENTFANYATFDNADCKSANLRQSSLNHASLINTNLEDADCSQADFENANLSSSNLVRTCFYESNLTGVRMQFARIIETNFDSANMNGCGVYGAAVWNPQLSNIKQGNFLITRKGEPSITVDDLEIAQFMYLLLNNYKIRNVIDTITTKVVLILGRFTPERKKTLTALQEALRARNYVSVLFDLLGPKNRDITETIGTIAHLSRFIIADITDPRSVPQELQYIIPNLPSVPIQPLLHTSAQEYGMFEHFMRYTWVLKPFRYSTVSELIRNLDSQIIKSVEELAEAMKKNSNRKGT